MRGRAGPARRGSRLDRQIPGLPPSTAGTSRPGRQPPVLLPPRTRPSGPAHARRAASTGEPTGQLRRLRVGFGNHRQRSQRIIPPAIRRAERLGDAAQHGDVVAALIGHRLPGARSANASSTTSERHPCLGPARRWQVQTDVEFHRVAHHDEVGVVGMSSLDIGEPPRRTRPPQ